MQLARERYKLYLRAGSPSFQSGEITARFCSRNAQIAAAERASEMAFPENSFRVGGPVRFWQRMASSDWGSEIGLRVAPKARS